MKKTGRPRKVAPLTSILHFSGLRQSVASMMYIKCGQNSTSESCFSSDNLLYCTTFSLETCMGVNVDQLRIIQAKYVFTTILSAYLLERRIQVIYKPGIWCQTPETLIPRSSFHRNSKWADMITLGTFLLCTGSVCYVTNATVLMHHVVASQLQLCVSVTGTGKSADQAHVVAGPFSLGPVQKNQGLVTLAKISICTESVYFNIQPYVITQLLCYRVAIHKTETGGSNYQSWLHGSLHTPSILFPHCWFKFKVFFTIIKYKVYDWI